MNHAPLVTIPTTTAPSHQPDSKKKPTRTMTKKKKKPRKNQQTFHCPFPLPFFLSHKTQDTDCRKHSRNQRTQKLLHCFGIAKRPEMGGHVT